MAPEALSRVSAYDILGSIALASLGMAAAGPLVESIGTSHTLWIGAALILLLTAAVLAVPEVRTLRTISADAPRGDIVGTRERWSQRADSNRGPADYASATTPSNGMVKPAPNSR